AGPAWRSHHTRPHFPKQVVADSGARLATPVGPGPVNLAGAGMRRGLLPIGRLRRTRQVVAPDFAWRVDRFGGLPAVPLLSDPSRREEDGGNNLRSDCSASRGGNDQYLGA